MYLSNFISDVLSLLGCNAVWIDLWLPTFRRNLVPLSKELLEQQGNTMFRNVGDSLPVNTV
jgi:hypothetical protein